MILYTLFTFIFFSLMTFIFFVMIKYKRLIESKKLEIQFLTFVFSSLDYKHYSIQLLELVYAEAIEQDASKKEELEKIKLKIEEKYEQFGNSLIINIKHSLDYETEYTDLKGAIKFIEDKLARAK